MRPYWRLGDPYALTSHAGSMPQQDSTAGQSATLRPPLDRSLPALRPKFFYRPLQIPITIQRTEKAIQRMRRETQGVTMKGFRAAVCSMRSAVLRMTFRPCFQRNSTASTLSLQNRKREYEG